jgi:murein DD-endopeptidase MepM/ murein hydrolase activator NlpD
MLKPKHSALLTFFALTFLLAFAPANASASMLVSNRTPRQGDTIEVVLPAKALVRQSGDSSDSQLEPTGESPCVTFNGHQYRAFSVLRESRDRVTGGAADPGVEESPRQYKALFAVPADLDPGKYSLKAGSETVSLTVRAGLFPLQHIHLAPSKDNFNTAPGEEEAVERAKSTLSAERYWREPFTAPSLARTSTGFGLKRMVNGRLLKDYFHSGLDFAGALGSPILATSSGKVVLVGRGFKLHGNTVAIDHGQGVISFYIHMKTIKVVEGEEVKRGQQIGTVGQTGRATGPHLHFSIYVNKVAANPSNWFTTTF